MSIKKIIPGSCHIEGDPGRLTLSDNINKVNIEVPNSVTSYTFILPENNGEPEQILFSDSTTIPGSVVTSWGFPRINLFTESTLRLSRALTRSNTTFGAIGNSIRLDSDGLYFFHGNFSFELSTSSEEFSFRIIINRSGVITPVYTSTLRSLNSNVIITPVYYSGTVNLLDGDRLQLETRITNGSNSYTIFDSGINAFNLR